jgi:hypothetical protein
MEISNSHTRIVPVHERELSSEQDTSAPELNPHKGSKRRHATVYDAVAGNPPRHDLPT